MTTSLPDLIHKVVTSREPKWETACAILYATGKCWHSGMAEDQHLPLAAAWISEHGNPLISTDAALQLLEDDQYVKAERYSDGWYACVAPRSNLPGATATQQPTAAQAICAAALMLMAKTKKAEPTDALESAPETEPGPSI